MTRSPLFALALAVALSSTVQAQDSNILFPPDTLERLLGDAPFRVLDVQGARAQGDTTRRAALELADGSVVAVRWKGARPGGHDFNNAPRYQLAAYELQKLFLAPGDYVVPPTVLRMIPIAEARRRAPVAWETFRGTGAQLVVLQYWLFSVTDEGVWDEERFRRDSLYARHFADMNVLTYLMRHNDANVGNILISSDTANPRVFAVDNDLAFGRAMSDRGTEWRQLRVDRVPRGTVARLRRITEADLERLLVVAQFEERAGALVRVPPGPPHSTGRGVTRRDGVVQLGLTAGEVRGVWRRLGRLLDRVDEGDIEVF